MYASSESTPPPMTPASSPLRSRPIQAGPSASRCAVRSARSVPLSRRDARPARRSTPTSKGRRTIASAAMTASVGATATNDASPRKTRAMTVLVR